MASMSLKDNSNKIVDTNMKIDFQSEEVNVHINQSKLSTNTDQITIVFRLKFFRSPCSWKVSHIIQFLMDHLDPTLVDYLSYYLSTFPIRHLLQLSVSCSSQDSTVQKSSPHKCVKKSSCNIFNAVLTAFSQIFWVSFLFVCSCHVFPSVELFEGSSQ